MFPSKASRRQQFLSASLPSPCPFDPVSQINLNLCEKERKNQNIIFKTMSGLAHVQKRFLSMLEIVFIVLFIYVYHPTMKTSRKPDRFGTVKVTNRYINTQVC